MTKEQALFLRDFLLQRVEASRSLTLDALRAIPDGQQDYRTRRWTRSARALAAHIIQTELMILDGIVRGGFRRASETNHQLASLSVAELAECYDRQCRAAVEQVRSLSVKQLTTYLSFYGLFRHPAVVFLTFAHDHTAHHRGQLNTYLRELGLTSSAAATAAPTMKYVWSERQRPSAQWPKLLTSGDTTTCS